MGLPAVTDPFVATKADTDRRCLGSYCPDPEIRRGQIIVGHRKRHTTTGDDGLCVVHVLDEFDYLEHVDHWLDRQRAGLRAAERRADRVEQVAARCLTLLDALAVVDREWIRRRRSELTGGY